VYNFLYYCGSGGRRSVPIYSIPENRTNKQTVLIDVNGAIDTDKIKIKNVRYINNSKDINKIIIKEQPDLFFQTNTYIPIKCNCPIFFIAHAMDINTHTYRELTESKFRYFFCATNKIKHPKVVENISLQLDYLYNNVKRKTSSDIKNILYAGPRIKVTKDIFFGEECYKTIIELYNFAIKTNTNIIIKPKTNLISQIHKFIKMNKHVPYYFDLFNKILLNPGPLKFVDHNDNIYDYMVQTDMVFVNDELVYGGITSLYNECACINMPIATYSVGKQCIDDSINKAYVPKITDPITFDGKNFERFNSFIEYFLGGKRG
jgi:hypothetical protein